MPLRKFKSPALFLFLFCLGIYLHNLSRAVTAGDVGDLISAASVAGVPHAPGYPLFTFLGFLLTRIHFITPAFMVGLISVFSSCFAVLIFYLLSYEFTKSKIISLTSSLILAFNYLFWFYGEIAEVFALNNFFIVILFYLSYLYYKKGQTRILYFLSFFAGLSITNHQTIILIFPSLFILSYTRLFKDFRTPKKILFSLIFIFLGFSVYLYVPIASHFNPPLNWDNVHDLQSFLHLFLRKDYGTFDSGSPTPVNSMQRVVILRTYLYYLLVQLTLPTVLISLLGILELLKKDKKLLISILLAFLISGPLFITYAGFPLQTSFYLGVYERFFVMSSVILLLLFPFGLLYFVNILNRLLKKKTYEPFFKGIFLIIPLMLLFYNFSKTDLHNVYIGNRLAYDFVSPLPKNSVLLMSGDTTLFNIWYVRYALNFRPDVEVINVNGLGANSFMNAETAKYLMEHPSQKDNPDLYVNVIKNISKTRPIFSFVLVQPKKGEKNIWVPYGIVYKLIPPGTQVPSEKEYIAQNNKIISEFKVPSTKELNSKAINSPSVADIPSVYAIAYLRIGSFIYSQYHDVDSAFSFFNKAESTDPSLYQDYDIFGFFYLYAKKDCSLAETNLFKAKELNPFDTVSYYLLYLDYNECFHDKRKSDAIIQEYNRIFKSNFYDDISKNKAKSAIN